MKTIFTLIKKDFVESLRSYKFLILALVFLLFGFLNPITAKLTPELLPQLLPDNLPIEIQPATSLDAWTQFFKNMSQVLLPLFLILFSGTLTNEFSKWRIIPLLTKGLKRKDIVLSKFIHLLLQWTALFIVNIGVSWLYTLILLPGGVDNILISTFFLWAYGVFHISLLLFLSVLLMNGYGVLIGLGGVSLFLTLLTIIPIIKTFNPYRLGADNLQLLTGGLYISDFYISLTLNTIMIIIFLLCSIKILNKKAL